MFSLLSGFFKWLFSKTEVQILIIGLDHAGKTTLLEQMKGIFHKSANQIPLDKIPPTVGLNIGRMDINNCRVIFWDLGGQIALRSIWDKYYSEAHGLIFVLDSADTDRFEEAKAAMESLVDHPELTGVPLLVCANKQDLPTAKEFEDIDAYFQITDDAAKHAASSAAKNSGSSHTSASNAEAGALLDVVDTHPLGIDSHHRSATGKRRERRLQPVSALTCSGIEVGIRWLIDAVISNPDVIRARGPH
ncbi:ADP-ribosylation factor-related protein 1 [Hondaea fermentalgiana]|uniref:ADP-ribosylation factor-related protein 1 n=1 Tax=Hondaea fermentalgiana TaxID=2315210 RepID=A0A2R5GXN1_9STRA|nr:ADP-ribosylation factor-related protein 1 [Hondaea fermentalgiana]|eukprot:GBG32724.1 ADP-ribosylation factor-related protein 1 [Hondaea fermentalgiana]